MIANNVPVCVPAVTEMLSHVLSQTDSSGGDSSDEETSSVTAAAAGTDSQDSATAVEAQQQLLARMLLRKKGATLKQKVVAVAKMARVFRILRTENENCVQLKQLTPNHKLPFGLLQQGKEAIKKGVTWFPSLAMQ